MRRVLVVPLFLIFALSACGEVVDTPTDHQFLGQPIFGGSEPTDSRFDPVVGLIIAGYYCSGTLIAPDVILTAGHCVTNYYGVVSAGDVEVYFGSDISGSGQYPVDSVVRHPDYLDSLYGLYDLGLIILATNVPSSVAEPMALMTDTSEEYIGRAVIFSGYGRTETGSIGTKLEVAGTISDLEHGTSWDYDNAVEEGITILPGQLRNEQEGENPRKRKDDTGTCGGDSGGPMIIEIGSTFHVAGVTSWGDTACRDYGYSVRVSSYIDVDEFLNPYVDEPEPCSVTGCVSGEICCDEVCIAPACSDNSDCGSNSSCQGNCSDGGTCAATCNYNDGQRECDGDACTDPDVCDAGMCLSGDIDSDIPGCAPTCGERGDSCTSGADCCSNSCHPRKGTCR